MAYENIRIERRGAVGVIALERPKALNALSAALMAELARALDGFEEETAIGAIVITGDERAFAAGADIKELRLKTFADVLSDDLMSGDWVRVAACRKPTVAAVAGLLERRRPPIGVAIAVALGVDGPWRCAIHAFKRG